MAFKAAAMTKKHYGKLAKQRILLRGESGKISIRQLCIRKGIPEQTYYRWRREVLAGHGLFALKLLSARMSAESSDPDESADSFTGAHMSAIHDPDPVPYGAWDVEPCPDDLLEADAQFPPAMQAICWQLARRDKFAVDIHGRLPRGDFTFVPLALPDDLRQRLARETRGSLNQTLVGLFRFALNVLEANGQALHLYNHADGLPSELNATPIATQ